LLSEMLELEGDELEEVILGLSETFKALSDSSRTKILLLLSRKPMCVGDLAQEAGISFSNASHQLRVLRNMGLVRPKKAGRMTYYALNDAHIERLLWEGVSHVKDLLNLDRRRIDEDEPREEEGR